MAQTEMQSFQTIGTQNGEGISIPLVVRHKHIDFIPNRFRLIMLKSGNGLLKIGKEQLQFIAPSVLCLPANAEPCTIVSSQAIETREIVFHPLLINPDYELVDPELLWIQAFIHRNDHYHGLVFVDPFAAQRMEALMSALEYELHHPHDNYWVCRSKSYLIEALLVVDRLAPQGNSVAQMPSMTVFSSEILQGVNGDPLVTEILMYLHMHYQEHVTIDYLSHHFAINRTTLNSKFKSATHTTIAQYLIDIRIHISKMLLAFTQLQVAEIVDRTGFNDLTHFSRSFKQRTGMTPMAYRQTFAK